MNQHCLLTIKDQEENILALPKTDVELKWALNAETASLICYLPERNAIVYRNMPIVNMKYDFNGDYHEVVLTVRRHTPLVIERYYQTTFFPIPHEIQKSEAGS